MSDLVIQMLLMASRIYISSFRPVHLKGNVNDQPDSKCAYLCNAQRTKSWFKIESINGMDTKTTMQYDSDVEECTDHVVMTDENPGVEREALKLINKFPYDETVKQTLLYVITSDSVTGLRIEKL